MAPGVGKPDVGRSHYFTQSNAELMLLLETHGRKETAQKAEGWRLPRKKISGWADADLKWIRMHFGAATSWCCG